MSDLVVKEPSFLQKTKWKIQSWLNRNKPSNIELHAIREFKAAGYMPLEQTEKDDPDRWIQEDILELIRVFSKQGHSGLSANYYIEVFSKLAKYELLVPLQGTEDEWVDVAHINGSPLWQNNRCSHVFRDETGVYDIEGKIFIEPDGCCYTNKDSRVYITFPYTPKREYVNTPV